MCCCFRPTPAVCCRVLLQHRHGALSLQLRRCFLCLKRTGLAPSSPLPPPPPPPTRCTGHDEVKSVICSISPSWVGLFVDEFNQALAKIVKVKDLDVQNFDGPLDFRVHAIPILQRVIQVLLCVLDAALQLCITHLCLP